MPGRSNSATEDSLASYVVSDKRQKFKEGKQESGSRGKSANPGIINILHCTDETKQELATGISQPN